MDKKKIDLMWGISLMTISVVTLIWSIAGIIGAQIPDAAARILGIIDLIALPFLAYSSVKKLKKNK